MVKNPPCNSGEAGLIPGWRTKILHAAEQLSLYTTTGEKQTKTPRSRINKLKKKLDGGVEEHGAPPTNTSQKYIFYMQNDSHRIPTEHCQKTSDTWKDKKDLHVTREDDRSVIEIC